MTHIAQDRVSQLASQIEKQAHDPHFTEQPLGKELHDMSPDERLAVAKKIQQDAQKGGIGKWNFTESGELLSVEENSQGRTERVEFDPKTGKEIAMDWSYDKRGNNAASHTIYHYDDQGRLQFSDSTVTTYEDGMKKTTDFFTAYDPGSGKVTGVWKDGKAFDGSPKDQVAQSKEI